jgi:hypothetical protein
VGRNQAGESLGSVGKIAGDVKACLLAELHLHDALVPAYCMCVSHMSRYLPCIESCSAYLLTLDNASNTNGCLERTAALGRVELLALLLGLASCA